MAVTKLVILKTIGLAILIVITTVGCNAHFNPGETFKDFRDLLLGKIGGRSPCDLLEKCPSNMMTLERVFVAFAIISLILSVASLVTGFLIDPSSLKFQDTVIHILIGLMLLIGGCLLVVSAIRVDTFAKDCIFEVTSESCPPSGKVFGKAGDPIFSLGDLRKQAKLTDKLSAGILALVNTIIYFVTSVTILKS